jgi:hypothetical protein
LAGTQQKPLKIRAGNNKLNKNNGNTRRQILAYRKI